MRAIKKNILDQIRRWETEVTTGDSSDPRSEEDKIKYRATQLRELQSMEWHLKKDLERERRKIKEVLEQEKIEERLKEERKAKWRMKPVRLSYSIRS